MAEPGVPNLLPRATAAILTGLDRFSFTKHLVVRLTHSGAGEFQLLKTAYAVPKAEQPTVAGEPKMAGYINYASGKIEARETAHERRANKLAKREAIREAREERRGRGLPEIAWDLAVANTPSHERP